MTITRSFGFVIENGLARYFYAGGDGVKRWSDTDKPVDSESDYISAMSAGIPPLGGPNPIATDEDKCRCSLRTRLVGDGCQYCNPKLHAELLADEAEHGVCAQCGTCGGVGTYDERLGGEFFSNPQAPCPDCDGLGVYAKPMTPDEEAEQVNLRG